MEIEISYIKEELDECKSQLVNQSFSDHHVINKDQDHSMKIREKNKEISKLLEEIEVRNIIFSGMTLKMTVF